MQKPVTINKLIDIIEHRDAYNGLKKLNVDINVIQAANPTHEQKIDLLERLRKIWEMRAL
jgi:hypothetical protein